MNRMTALALVIAAAAAGTARADDGTYETPPFVSSATRAEVLAELQQYRQSGVNPWADEYNPVAQMRSDRTREEVTREYIASRDAVAAFNGEDSGSAYLARRDNGHGMATNMAHAPAAGQD